MNDNIGLLRGEGGGEDPWYGPPPSKPKGFPNFCNLIILMSEPLCCDSESLQICIHMDNSEQHQSLYVSIQMNYKYWNIELM